MVRHLQQVLAHLSGMLNVAIVKEHNPFIHSTSNCGPPTVKICANKRALFEEK